MGFMDKVLDTARSAASAASEKAGEVYEIGKLKLQLSGLNSDLEKAYAQLGRLEYEARKNGSDNSLLLDACVTELDSLHADIDSLIAEISAVTGEKTCPHCGESVAVGAALLLQVRRQNGCRTGSGAAARTDSAGGSPAGGRVGRTAGKSGTGITQS